MVGILDFFTPGINPNAPDPRAQNPLLALAMQSIRPNPLVNIGATIASLGGPIGANVAQGLRQQQGQRTSILQNLVMLDNLQRSQRRQDLTNELVGLVTGQTPLPDEAARVAAAEEGQVLPSREQRVQGLLAQLDPGAFLESQLGGGELDTKVVQRADGSDVLINAQTGEVIREIGGPSEPDTGLQPPAVIDRNRALVESVINDPASSEEEVQTAQRLLRSGAIESMTTEQVNKNLGIAETRDISTRTARRDERAEALKATKQPRDTLMAASAVLEDVNAAITPEGRLIDQNTGEPPDLPGVNLFRLQVGEGNVRLFSGIPVRELTEPQRRLRQNLQRVVNSRLTEGAGKSQTLSELKNIAQELGLSVDEETLELKIIDEDRVIQGLENIIGRASSEIRDRLSIDTPAGQASIRSALKRAGTDRFLNPSPVQPQQRTAPLTETQAAALSKQEAINFVNTVSQEEWEAMSEKSRRSIKNILSR